jgi:hypothetical protein
MSDFYVGYQPQAPSGLRKFLRTLVLALLALSAVVAILMVIGQNPFPASRFEFQQYRRHEGLIVLDPHPRLLTANGSYLLVGSGKHGADEAVKPFHLKTVSLNGALIEREGQRMLELAPEADAVRPLAGSRTSPHTTETLGPVSLTGEIVDSKCHLGVMNPGQGKVHRACASNCIRGGVPPGFLVRDAQGSTRFLLLTGKDNRAVNLDVLDYVAEPVTIRGVLSRVDGMLVLAMDPGGLRRVARE